MIFQFKVLVDYKKVQDKVSSTKAYTDLKSQYGEAKKKVGDSFEKQKANVTESLNSVKEQTKRFEKQIKSGVLQITIVQWGQSGEQYQLKDNCVKKL